MVVYTLSDHCCLCFVVLLAVAVGLVLHWVFFVVLIEGLLPKYVPMHKQALSLLMGDACRGVLLESA